jgi:hypothetical protein
MNHEGRVRDMERAAVDRWFARTPLGTMFHAGRGRTLPVPPDAVPGWQDEAYAIVDKFIVDSRPPSQWAMVGVILAFTCVMLALQPLLGFEGAHIGVIVMGGLMLWHVGDFWRLWCYRRDLGALRNRIAASLALRTPVPAELGNRFRRGNVWRTVLHLWVAGLAAFMLLSMHFMPVETIDTAVFLATLGALGVAWLLYFLARRTDLFQAQGASLASRPNPPISRP